MTRPEMPDETRRLLDQVLDDEGRTRAPDRMLEGVYARTQATRQARRRPWDGMRIPTIHGGPAPLIAVVLLVVGALAIASGAGSRFVAPPPAQPSPTPVASPALATCADGGPLGGGAAALWVGCPTGIRLVDTAIEPLAAGDMVEGVGVPVAGGAGTWSIGQGGLVEIDPVTGLGRTIDVPGVAALAVGDTSLWGGTTEQSVLRIDPVSGTVTGTIDVGAKPLALVEAGSSVWVSADDGLVHRYDVETLEPDGPTAVVGSDAARIAANTTGVYVVSQGIEGTVTRIDRTTDERTSVVVAEGVDRRSLGELVAGDDAVWVTRRTDILRLDPITLAPGPPQALPGYPVGLVRDGAEAWVLADTGRLDLVTLP